MSDFHAAYPDYATTSRLDELRADEYTYLDAGGHTYLDYTGAGLPARLPARSRTRTGSTAGCYGNPHSENPTSTASTNLVERTRERVLEHLGADPAEYVVVFTPNATGACRLVGEAFPFRPAAACRCSPLDNHNSVNGLREFARARGAWTSSTWALRHPRPAIGADVAGLGAGGLSARGEAGPVRVPGAEQFLWRATPARLDGAGAVGRV